MNTFHFAISKKVLYKILRGPSCFCRNFKCTLKTLKCTGCKMYDTTSIVVMLSSI